MHYFFMDIYHNLVKAETNSQQAMKEIFERISGDVFVRAQKIQPEWKWDFLKYGEVDFYLVQGRVYQSDFAVGLVDEGKIIICSEPYLEE